MTQVQTNVVLAVAAADVAAGARSERALTVEYSLSKGD